MTMYCAGLHSQRVLLLLLLLLSLMNTHILCIPVWAQGLVPGHSDSTAGGAPAVEDYDYESNYDYDGNPKTGASANSTRYAPFGFGTKSYLQPFFTIFSYYPVFNYHHYRYSVVFFLYLSLYQYKPILWIQCSLCIYFSHTRTHMHINRILTPSLHKSRLL